MKKLLSFLLCLSLLLAAVPVLAETAPTVTGKVIEIEKYGHALLDVTIDDFTAAGFTLGDVVTVTAGTYNGDMPYFNGYYVDKGEYMVRAYPGHTNIAVCINYGKFAETSGVKIGDEATITLAEKAGMLDVQEICALWYSNDRADYPDDASFANFRSVTAGGIGSGKLYRTASPIDNRACRAAYANDFIQAASVVTVLNLSDSAEDIEEMFEAEDFRSEYYRSLYEAGNVAALDLAADFYSEGFAASVAEGLGFLAQKEAPYAVHCLEGKDRAGAVAALLEALMGAELNEIMDDYMLSYYNYYGITEEKEPERYQTILDINLLPFLCHVAGVDESGELVQADLQAAATRYLLNAGMAQEDIAALKAKLG
jgi:protein tyrosine/serine phosphatase